ncbi:hypothetical protein CW304_32545 [Bacillus sp. UFRGS-B20]|nr:hypothetical protein CW304_32545 [Bacillus sp. UFRGS-B20]
MFFFKRLKTGSLCSLFLDDCIFPFEIQASKHDRLFAIIHNLVPISSLIQPNFEKNTPICCSFDITSVLFL